jgi:hypothetical protein
MTFPRARTALPVALLACLIVGFSAVGQTQAPAPSDSGISVRISPEKHIFSPGESVVLDVEIWNGGPKDVFIYKEFQGPDNALATLELKLYDEKGQAFGKDMVVIFDCFCAMLGNSPSAPPMTKVLYQYWTLLPRGHSYGGKVTLSASDYKRLSNPGKYRIQGEYQSLGFLAENVNNPLMDYAEELKKLPYESWAGKVETNSVSIEVAKAVSRSR